MKDEDELTLPFNKNVSGGGDRGYPKIVTNSDMEEGGMLK